MATILDLKNKIEESRLTVSQIKQFIFDDKSVMNQNTVEYPLLLVRIPDSEWENRQMESQVFDMEMFIFDTELSDSPEHWTVKLSDIEGYLRSVIKGFDDNKYLIISNPRFERAHFQGNDKLIGVQATFQLKVHYGC